MNDPSALALTSVSILQKKIGWICQAVRLTVLLWLGSSVTALGVMWTDRAHYFDRTAAYYEIDPASITTSAYWSAAAVAAAKWLLVAWVVRRIWALMQGYLDGDIFTVSAAERLRLVAIAGFVATIGNLIANPIEMAILSTRFFAKVPLWGWVSPDNFLYLFFCGLLLAIAAIFKTAAALAEDHAQIV